jgi:VWFA-related protein
MMRSASLALIAAVSVLEARQGPIRVETELVRLDVLVERNGHPVGGLIASDFVVEDNGVPQRIRLLPETEAVSVSSVLDVSGSMTADQLNNADAGIRALMGALHERDRHALYAFAGDVRRIESAGRPAPPSAGAIAGALRQAGGPRTSLFDALFTAILRSDDRPGPRMLAVLTDGRDNTSWLGADAVIDAAIRHETVVYAVAVGLEEAGPFDVPPVLRHDGRRLLQLLADRTGGRVVDAAWSSDLASVFGTIIHEYRQRYIIGFVPEGVKRGDGWHRLTVKLRRRAGRIHARDGYWSR